MFEVVDIKSYDKGKDWHTDYIIASDEDLNLEETIKRLEHLGHNICGIIKLEKSEKENINILKTIMF